MKKKLLIIFFFIQTITLFADPSINKYLDYLKQYPETLGPIGKSEIGEIQILKDKKKIEEIEKKTNKQTNRYFS
jgi:hypothetical protein